MTSVKQDVVNGTRSLLKTFPLRRGTVLGRTNLTDTEIWNEDEAVQIETTDDADDDKELDNALNYAPLKYGFNIADVWDLICQRRFYWVEGDKFYCTERISQRNGEITEVCILNGKRYILKRVPCTEPEHILKAADHFSNLRNYDHPHISYIYKAGIGNSPTLRNWMRTEVRFILPYVNGHLLSEELEYRRRKNIFMHPKRVLRLFREILDAVFEIHSHSNGDAHRDLRPGCILIREPDDWPLIVDLDTCTAAVIDTSDDMETREFIEILENRVSPFYRAPETFVINSQPVIDERADVWSLGCLLYAMCFFRSPFQCDEENELPSKTFNRDVLKTAIWSFSYEEFMNVYVTDSPYPSQMHEYMARLLSPDLAGRLTVEQAIRELDELIAVIGGPDQPICVKHPWLNPAADAIASDVLQKRFDGLIAFEFDKLYPEAAKFSYQDVLKEETRKEKQGFDLLPKLRQLRRRFGFSAGSVLPHPLERRP